MNMRCENCYFYHFLSSSGNKRNDPENYEENGLCYALPPQLDPETRRPSLSENSVDFYRPIVEHWDYPCMYFTDFQEGE